MNEIKIKIKEQEPSDEQLLKRKDFNGSYKTYVEIKNSYARITALWGAAIGMAVFVGFVGVKLLISEQTNQEVVLKEKQLSTNQSYNEILNNPSASKVSKKQNHTELNKNKAAGKLEEKNSKKANQINNNMSPIVKEPSVSVSSTQSNLDKESFEVSELDLKLDSKLDSGQNNLNENPAENKKQQKGINIQYIAE